MPFLLLNLTCFPSRGSLIAYVFESTESLDDLLTREMTTTSPLVVYKLGRRTDTNRHTEMHRNMHIQIELN